MIIKESFIKIKKTTLNVEGRSKKRLINASLHDTFYVIGV